MAMPLYFSRYGSRTSVRCNILQECTHSTTMPVLTTRNGNSNGKDVHGRPELRVLVCNTQKRNRELTVDWLAWKVSNKHTRQVHASLCKSLESPTRFSLSVAKTSAAN